MNPKKQPFETWWLDFLQVVRDSKVYKEDIIRENFRSRDFISYFDKGLNPKDAFVAAQL